MPEIMKTFLLVISPESIFKSISERLDRNRALMHKNRFFDATDYLRNNLAECLIFFIDQENSKYRAGEIIECKRNFEQIPVICILEKIDIETVRLLGSIGVDKIITFNELGRLAEAVNSLTFQHSAAIKLVDFGIDPACYNQNTGNALRYMEKNYVKIISLVEIESFIGVPESFLSREFKRAELQSPKKILLLFKVKHATKLMVNRGLGLKQIALYSGFTSEKRFNECFHRMFPCSPSSFRAKQVFKDDHIWGNFSLKLRTLKDTA